MLSLLEEDEPQFVAVFGRRRIGKTHLIRETFNHKFIFQHTGVSNNQIETGKRKEMQLEKFSESLSKSIVTMIWVAVKLDVIAAIIGFIFVQSEIRKCEKIVDG